MKTLIVVIHPQLSQSVVNKRWVEEIRKYPDQYTLHDLYATYPTEQIDIEKEQQLIAAHNKIIFQFPFYWFNCPPLFKKWLDEVLTHGWAYGSKSGYQLQDKKIALAISAGVDEAGYTRAGQYGYTLEELTAPFKLSFDYVKADYQPLFAAYDFEFHTNPEHVEASTQQYMAYLQRF